MLVRILLPSGSNSAVRPRNKRVAAVGQGLKGFRKGQASLEFSLALSLQIAAPQCYLSQDSFLESPSPGKAAAEL